MLVDLYYHLFLASRATTVTTNQVRQNLFCGRRAPKDSPKRATRGDPCVASVALLRLDTWWRNGDAVAGGTFS